MGMDGQVVVTSSLKIFKILSAGRPERKQFKYTLISIICSIPDA